MARWTSLSIQSLIVTETIKTNETEKRKRGRRPADAGERRERVIKALKDLTDARVPFSMGDLAERVGISRATLYRDATLRDLIGEAGDGPATRPVDYAQFQKLQNERQEWLVDRRKMRREVREREKREVELLNRIDFLMRENTAMANEIAVSVGHVEAREKLKAEAYTEGFNAGVRTAAQQNNGRRGGGSSDLQAMASRIPRPVLLQARKTLIKTLHPDLFENDPAVKLLATELLKQINDVVSTG
jgi:hypothetical protein